MNRLSVQLKDFKRDLSILFQIHDYVRVYDPISSLVEMKPILNILNLDAILITRHGNYENNNQSMRDIVLKHYGSEGVKFIENHL
jgi:hypothetical protein